MRKLELVTGSPRRPEATDAQPPADAPTAVFDERFGMRLGQRSYYVNVRIGCEQRSCERRAREGQVRVSGVAFFYCVVCSGAIMLFGTLCILYLIKSGLGIDLSDGHSVLHPLFELAGWR
jgi:hypothetical protein